MSPQPNTLRGAIHRWGMAPMTRYVVRASIAFVLVVALILPPPPAAACGPFFPVTIFIQRNHPDLPLENFAAGSLGVLQPTYASSYLAVAYRYLSYGSFDASEQQQLVALWAHRLDREAEWLKKRMPTTNGWKPDMCTPPGPNQTRQMARTTLFPATNSHGPVTMNFKIAPTTLSGLPQNPPGPFPTVWPQQRRSPQLARRSGHRFSQLRRTVREDGAPGTTRQCSEATPARSRRIGPINRCCLFL